MLLYLKTSLLQSAWSAIRQKNGYWQVMFYRLKARLGAKKAIIAIARRILKVIYLALKFGMKYENLNLKDDPNRINKAIQYHTKKLEELSKKASPAIAA